MAVGATLGATFALLAPKPHPCFPTVPPWKGLGVCAPGASAPAESGGLPVVLRLGLKPRASVLPRVCKTALLAWGERTDGKAGPGMLVSGAHSWNLGLAEGWEVEPV